MVNVSGGEIRDVMPWGRGSCGSCNPKLYSHSAGSLRIRFRGSALVLLPLPDIVAVGAVVVVDTAPAAAGDAAVVDDANACDRSVVVVVIVVVAAIADEAEAAVSVSATRVDSEHWVVRILRDDEPAVVVVVVDENVIGAGANADPRDDDESNTSSKADTEKLVIVFVVESRTLGISQTQTTWISAYGNIEH